MGCELTDALLPIMAVPTATPNVRLMALTVSPHAEVDRLLTRHSHRLGRCGV